jgi:hypothetical protein
MPAGTSSPGPGMMVPPGKKKPLLRDGERKRGCSSRRRHDGLRKWEMLVHVGGQLAVDVERFGIGAEERGRIAERIGAELETA